MGLVQVKKLFAAVVEQVEEKDRLQEWFGYYCVDNQDVAGRAGRAVDGWFMLQIGRDNVWPVGSNYESWDEDTLFDMVELLYDHVSEVVDGYFHSYSGCGMHGREFAPEPARSEYRQAVNRVLGRYKGGFRLSEDGHVEHLGPTGLDELHDQAQSVGVLDDRERVRDAVHKFRRRSSTPSDRRDAVRDLADVLERIRPLVKQHMLRKDESALFQIANQFAIRHNNAQQRGEYDTDLWWEWMFNVYLATYYAIASIVRRESGPEPQLAPTDFGPRDELGEEPF